MSTLKDSDPCSDIVLDFVAKGESGGNYNAVIGNSTASDDLGALTLTQIYDLQAKLLAEGQPSSAIGRYQFIKSTLVGVVQRLNLPDSTLFTPATQDALAIELLRGDCGYAKWYVGALDDVEFAHRLSLQWASLPDPNNSGKSHYDGVGPNHAGTTLDKVYAMLVAARAALPASAVASSTSQTAPSAPPTPATKAPISSKLAVGSSVGAAATGVPVVVLWLLSIWNIPAPPTEVLLVLSGWLTAAVTFGVGYMKRELHIPENANASANGVH